MWDYIRNRLLEPSTWQGILTFVAGTAQVTLDPNMANAITTVAIGLIGALWIVKKDAKSKDALVSPTAVNNGKAAGK